MIKAISLVGVLFAGLLFGGWCTASPTQAAMVQYQIQNGTQGNFGFSDLHDSTGMHMNISGTDYYASGNVLSGPITGSLFGDQQIVGTTVTLSDITGVLTGTGGLTLSFTNGSLTGSTGTAYNADGWLDVTLSHASITGGSRSERFFFHPEQFTSPTPGANTFDGLLFGLWGNNWNNGVDATPAIANTGTLNSVRLGLDLKGTVAPVPLPGALLLFGTGLGGLMLARTRNMPA